MNQLEQRLKKVLTGEGAILKAMEPMARHTTFRIGGPAQWYAAPSGEEELRELLAVCRRETEATFWSVMRAATAWLSL